ncbi:unnamed protein product [Brugia pahangi]|uniref:DUF4806 domain-containing protein n=1 Tax=Brugia pahangi TaxID=6280 RepID=A0A0N4TU74_BRUPA|nr:unnamed protein product [Brugia pahangi]
MEQILSLQKLLHHYDAGEGPFEKPRFGLRKAAGFQSAIENDHDDTEKPTKASDVEKADKYDKLAEDIPLFMVHRKGQALTDEILQSFKNHVSVKDSFAFRSILKRLYILHKNSNLWVFRDEYQ